LKSIPTKTNGYAPRHGANVSGFCRC